MNPTIFFLRSPSVFKIYYELGLRVITWRNEASYFPANADFVIGQRKRWNTSSSVVVLANLFGTILVIFLAESLTLQVTLRLFLMKQWKRNLALKSYLDGNALLSQIAGLFKTVETSKLLMMLPLIFYPLKLRLLHFFGKPTTSSRVTLEIQSKI